MESTAATVTLEPGTYDWDPTPECGSPFPNFTKSVEVTLRQGTRVTPGSLLWENVSVPFPEDIIKVHISDPVEIYADMLFCFVTPGKTFLEPGEYTWTPPKYLKTGNPFNAKPLLGVTHRSGAKDLFWGGLCAGVWNNENKNFDIVAIDLKERAEIQPHLLQYFTRKEPMESTPTENFEISNTTTLPAGIWAWDPSGEVHCPFTGPLDGMDVVLEGNYVRENGIDVRSWRKGIHLEVTEVRLSRPATIYSWARKFFFWRAEATVQSPDFIQPSDLPGIALAEKVVAPAPAAEPAKARPTPKPAFVCGLGVVAEIGQKPSLKPLQ